MLVAALLAALSVFVLLRDRSASRLTASRGAPLPRPPWTEDVLIRLRHRVPRGRTHARRQRQRLAEGVAGLAAELRSGQPVRSAFVRSMEPTLAPHAVVAARWGGDVAAALCEDAALTGQAALRAVAACWQVGEGSGAGLAAAMDRLVATLRSAEEVRSELSAHLAAPRATARMLAMLPLIGVLMAMALGGNPLAWLLSGIAGRLCLLGGIGLTVLGLWWTGRIAARVERLL